MNFFTFIVQDWKANAGNTKGRIILFCFRMANFCSTRRLYFFLGFLYIIFYRIMIEWVLGIEIPWNVKIGRNLRLFHGQGLVIHKKTVIGHNCTLRHCTTIGITQQADGLPGLSPVIGNHVDVGSNACIIGPVQIGDYVKVGSGTVVVKDVAANSTVVGNPGRVIRKEVQHGRTA